MSQEMTIPQTAMSSQIVPAAPAVQPISQPLVESETASYSILVTVTIGIGLAVLASVATRHLLQDPSSPWIIWLAVAVGGLGGLTHEIAQSGGKILFFQRKLDGFYLGSLAGVILGAVAGLLAARGMIVNPDVAKVGAQPGPIPLIFEVFFAGLALKGVAEAAGGQAVSPPAPTLPNIPNSNLGIGGGLPAALPPAIGK